VPWCHIVAFIFGQISFMKNRLLKVYTLFLFPICISISNAQNTVPVPVHFDNAVAKNYRTHIGKPGPAYFTNFAHYNFKATLDVANAGVRANGTIKYFNKSNDTLHQLGFKLLQNVHLPTTQRQVAVTPEYLTNGIILTQTSINNQEHKLQADPGNATNGTIILNKPVMPNDSVEISLAWHYKLNRVDDDIREGVVDSNAFFVAYWYPQIAVYSERGWDKTPHAEQAEFFNGFANYDVSITVPEQYMVLATGALQNANEVYTESVAGRIEEAATNDDINLCILKPDIVNKQITQPKANTWHFKADSVTDFAWGTSNHYLLDAASIMVDSITKRRVVIQVAYDTTAKNYSDVCDWSQKALAYLSFKMPGVAYPYSNLSVFQGHSFMEYPMMVNDADDTDTNNAQSTTLHEIAHAYMPFLLGIDESRYAFMDEGWVTFFELMGNTYCFKQKDGQILWKNFYCKGKRAESITPIMVNSFELSESYGFNAYGKPALAYYTLYQYLGETKFKQALQHYINVWRNKHPLPLDFFNAINQSCNMNLNWLYNNWFYEFNYFDLSISTVKIAAKAVVVTVENKGGKMMPFELVYTFEDGTTKTSNHSCAVWKLGRKSIVTQAFTKKIKQVHINTGVYPDAVIENNIWNQ
jgi:hypothetical protein